MHELICQFKNVHVNEKKHLMNEWKNTTDIFLMNKDIHELL